MRRIKVFLPEPCPLLHSKPVLFINNYKSQVVELNILFKKCMCANEDIKRAVEK